MDEVESVGGVPLWSLGARSNYDPGMLFRPLQGSKKDNMRTRHRVQREDRFWREHVVFAKSVELRFSRGLNHTLQNSL